MLHLLVNLFQTSHIYQQNDIFAGYITFQMTLQDSGNILTLHVQGHINRIKYFFSDDLVCGICNAGCGRISMAQDNSCRRSKADLLILAMDIQQKQQLIQRVYLHIHALFDDADDPPCYYHLLVQVLPKVL